MKRWHVLVLAASIIAGAGTIALVDGVKERYHYTAYTVFNLPTRIDRYSGSVEVFDKNYGGWTDAVAWRAK
jgi:hypothetical protein